VTPKASKKLLVAQRPVERVAMTTKLVQVEIADENKAVTEQRSRLLNTGNNSGSPKLQNA
jgi:hypothetical protein